MPSGPVRTRHGSRDVGLSLIRKLARGMGVAVPSASVSATLMRSRPLSWEEAASHNSSATIILTSYFLLLTSNFLLLPILRERAARLGQRVRAFGRVDIAFGIHGNTLTRGSLVDAIVAFER